MVNKSLKCSSWYNLKNDSIISVHVQGKPFNITIIQVYAPTMYQFIRAWLFLGEQMN